MFPIINKKAIAAKIKADSTKEKIIAVGSVSTEFEPIHNDFKNTTDDKILKALKIINRILIFVIFLLVLFSINLKTVSWNDRSRFATIQNLVENHSFIIDNSNFPTGDKVLINGHFYSDKPPLFSIFASAPYALLYLFGFSILKYPQLVIYTTTLLIISVPLAIYFLYLYQKIKMGSKRPRELSLLLTISLLVGTVMLPYATVLNNHLPASLLIGFATLILFFQKLNKLKLFAVSFLIALAGTFDPGAVFIYFFFTAYSFIIVWKTNETSIEKIKGGAYYMLGFLIPFSIHYLTNLQITGDIFPASMHPELFNYPGSPFSTANLTSASLSVVNFKEWILYLYLLLFGKRGFLLHNPVLILAIAASIFYFFKTKELKTKVYSACSVLAMASIVLYYSLTGKSAGGPAYSVRWFIIFVPMFFPIIIRWLENKKWRYDLIIFICLITSVWNLAAIGTVYSGQNNQKRYSFVNALKSFPVFFWKQYYEWKEIVH